MTFNKIINTASLIIVFVLCIEYLDYFIAALGYPFNIFQNEAFSTRISLYFFSHGLSFGNLAEHSGVITIYGFFYELVCTPLLFIMNPSVNIGRIISFSSTLLTISGLIVILRRRNINWYYSIVFVLLVILYKPLALYTCLSKNDAFAALLTLVVLYSLYFHKGKTQFVFTLIFTSLALATKQTTVFILPVIFTWWFINRKDYISFIKKTLMWIIMFVIIFAVLFLTIPNYYFNTITLSGYIGTVSPSYHHLIFDQVIPLIRGTGFFLALVIFAIIKLRKRVRYKEYLTPALLYILFYLPLFLYTSLSTGSMPVYYIFTFIGLSIFIPEVLSKFETSAAIQNEGRIKPWFNTIIFLQLTVFLLAPSSKDIFKFTYFKPTKEQIEESSKIDSIIRSKGAENSFVTFSRSSFGLSTQSAPYFFDFVHGYLLGKKRLDTEPYIRDFDNKKFSIIVGSIDYPVLKDAIDRNYYLYKIIGDTPLYLPKK